MQILTLAGVAIAVLSVAQPAVAEIDSSVGAPPAPAHNAVHVVQAAPPIADMPPPPPKPITADGRWIWGHQAPGGWNAYHAPDYGAQLPRYWMTPAFHIGDYRAHGLDRPAAGYGWSRYYDDAVLTDQWGRVYDARGNHDWNRGKGGASGRNNHDNDRYYDSYRGAHWSGQSWGGGYAQAYATDPNDMVTEVTTTITHYGGGAMMAPRRVVTYENVYAAAPVRTKMKARRTTKLRPRVRGDY